MSGFEVFALVVAGAWLGVLTLVMVLVVRQIGLLTVRMDHSTSKSVIDPRTDGPDVGSRVPLEVVDLVPQISSGRTVILHVSSTCDPCRKLVADLRSRRRPVSDSFVVLVSGREEYALALVDMLPQGIHVVRDPDATIVAHGLQIHSVPFAVLVQDGEVEQGSYLFSASDLYKLADEPNGAQGHGVTVGDAIVKG